MGTIRDDGKYVLPPPPAVAASAGSAIETSDFLRHLAAYSRGNAGVAWSLWRRALRTMPDADSAAAEPESDAGRGSTVWVVPWKNLEPPATAYLEPRHDAARVRETLRDVGLTSPFLQLERPVAVVVREKPFGTHYRLKAYPVDPRDQVRFVTDLTVRGKAALAEIGVDFASSPLLA